MSVEDKYLDVLQNIEFGIASYYREHPALTDYDVMHVLEALICLYKAEIDGRTPSPRNLSETEQALLDRVRRMCEWRLGRERMESADANKRDILPTPKTVDEILLCLKRLLKSVKMWNKEGGRQGYLRFIANFV